MRYADFIQRVEDRAAGGLTYDQAHEAVGAVLETLAGSLPVGLAADLAAQLPTELQPPFHRRGPSAPPSKASEFLDLVAEREGVSRSEAFDRSRAVMNALGEAVSLREMERVRARLPEDFETLFRPPAAAKWPETHAPRVR